MIILNKVICAHNMIILKSKCVVMQLSSKATHKKVYGVATVSIYGVAAVSRIV